LRKESIKQYLAPFRFYGKRSTSVTAGVVGAMAPRDEYKAERVDQALRLLGQDPGGDLRCVYCSAPATSWDHLVGLVKDKLPSGAGHVYGNLVPCCATCNSQKGNRAWRDFVDRFDEPGRTEVTLRIERLLRGFFGDAGIPADPFPFPPEVHDRIFGLRDRIHDLMREIDEIVIAHRQGSGPDPAAVAPDEDDDSVPPSVAVDRLEDGMRQAFYEQVFARLAGTDIRVPALRDRTWAPFHSGPFGAFWIWMTRSEIRVICYLDTPLADVDKADFNLQMFSLLSTDQAEIESQFGGELTWEALGHRRACWIGVTRPTFDLSDDSARQDMAIWAADAAARMVGTFERRARLLAAEVRDVLRRSSPTSPGLTPSRPRA